ncbi:protein kinase domain-containing protein [Yinghuangia sp. YIM S09857]|uniref:protein kinase domain-containing protein n=1 Tax=Yinghuangia sp. YIM S09857 TaxID=3436929 RepID=UPI003F539094
MRVLASRYELHETVGRGGMGEVWRGRDRELDRTVAVKVLPAELTRHDEFRARFRREARVAASLSHHGVAVLHDVGEDDGGGESVPFLVMEFVAGATLAEEVRGGPLAPDRAVGFARDIADTLVHSHGQGLVHRDIKPSNVMLTPAGGVKVLDFGIAKALADTATRLTSTGGMVGTPAYLSPEQIDGADVDGRTDVYSLGCLLYELLTGRPPFTGDSPFAVMNQHLSKAPAAPSELRPEVPASVDAVVLRALAKKADERYPDAGSFRAALEQVREAARQTVVAVPAPPPIASAPTAHAYRSEAVPAAWPPGAVGVAGPASGSGPAAGAAWSSPPIPGQPPGPPPVPAGPNGMNGVGGAGPYAPMVYPGPGGYPPPSGAPRRPTSAAPLRDRLTADSALALIGCVLVAYLQLSDVGQWSHDGVSKSSRIVWVAGLLALPWAPRVSAALVWGVAAFAAVDPHVHRDKIIAVLLLWGAALLMCFWMAVRRDPRRGALAVVCGWLVFRMASDAFDTRFGESYENAATNAFWVMFVVMLLTTAVADVLEFRSRARSRPPAV